MQDRFDNGANPDLTDDDVATVFRTSDERIEQLLGRSGQMSGLSPMV